LERPEAKAEVRMKSLSEQALIARLTAATSLLPEGIGDAARYADQNLFGPQAYRREKQRQQISRAALPWEPAARGSKPAAGAEARAEQAA